MHNILKYMLIILIIFFFCRHETVAETLSFDPWDFNVFSTGAPVSSDSSDRDSSLSIPGKILWLGVKGYRETVASVDGERCRMVPTCSAYSMESIEKHGFIMGILMTVDRLLREMDEMELAPVVMFRGDARFSDPVSANDFWWNKATQLDKQSLMGNLATQES